ncbi:MAG: acyl-CoA thioesterase [Vicinamibacterales bacterium]
MTADLPPRLSEYRLRRRVNFYEVDSVGIVHFSWFARYMEEAEHALWRAAGLSIAPRRSEVGFPRVSISFDFKAPLHFEDEFEVLIRILKIGRKSIRYSCLITCGDREIAIGSLAIASVRRGVDGAMMAVPLPEWVTDRLAVSREAGA